MSTTTSVTYLEKKIGDFLIDPRPGINQLENLSDFLNIDDLIQLRMTCKAIEQQFKGKVLEKKIQILGAKQAIETFCAFFKEYKHRIFSSTSESQMFGIWDNVYLILIDNFPMLIPQVKNQPSSFNWREEICIAKELLKTDFPEGEKKLQSVLSDNDYILEDEDFFPLFAQGISVNPQGFIQLFNKIEQKINEMEAGFNSSRAKISLAEVMYMVDCPRALSLLDQAVDSEEKGEPDICRVKSFNVQARAARVCFWMAQKDEKDGNEAFCALKEKAKSLLIRAIELCEKEDSLIENLLGDWTILHTLCVIDEPEARKYFEMLLKKIETFDPILKANFAKAFYILDPNKMRKIFEDAVKEACKLKPVYRIHLSTPDMERGADYVLKIMKKEAPDVLFSNTYKIQMLMRLNPQLDIHVRGNYLVRAIKASPYAEVQNLALEKFKEITPRIL